MANTKVTSSLIESGAINASHVTGLTSAHIAEGSNLYHTDARSRASISVGGSDIAYNSSTGVITGSRPSLAQVLGQGNSTGSANIAFPSSQKIQFNSDLEIYNDGSSNLIQGNGGTLYIQAKAGENSIIASPDAAVNLYHNNQLKFETISTGISVTGVINSSGGITASHINTGQGATEVHMMNQDVRTTDDVTFDDLTVTGNLNITGDINSYNVTDLDVVDKTITLGKGQTAANSDLSGITIDGSNAQLFWSQGNTRWQTNHSFLAVGNLTAYRSDNTQIMAESAGDYFPSYRIRRTGGSSKTNYTWEFQIGSTGFLNFKDITNSYYPIILNTSGDVLLGSDTSGQNPTVIIDESATALEVRDGGTLRAYRSGNSAYAGLFMDSGEKLYIRNSWGTKDIVMLRTGEVGIGTDNPSALLHLKSTATGATPSIIFENTNNAQNMNIDYWNNAGAVQSRIQYAEGPAAWNFIPNTSTNNSALYIAYDGKVGIGTTSPEAQMELYKIVDGDAQNLLIMNQKSYGVGTGTNERASINLGIAEASQTSLSRLFGNIHVRPYNESDSSHGIFSFGVRGTGAIRDDVLVLRGYSSTDQRVGIGTNDPDAKLEVKRSSDGSHFRLARNGVGSWDFKVQGVPTLPGVGLGALELIPTVGNSYFAVGIAGGGTTLLHVKNTGLYTVDGTAASPAYSFNSDSDTGFYRPSSNALGLVAGGVERIRISSSGDVSVNGGVFTTTHDITTVNKFKTTNNNTRSIISMESKDPSGNTVDLRMHALGDGPRGEIYTFTNHPLAFATNNAAPQMTLLTNGNFGIGNPSPTHKLHVAGDIRINNGSALKLYNAAGNAWGEFRYDNSSDQITHQRTLRSGTDSAYNLGTPSFRYGYVYAKYAQAYEGFTSDVTAKQTVWRALGNSSNGGIRYVKICRITAYQSARIKIDLAGRSTSYGDGAFPAKGSLVGQLNNDDNYDFTYYDYNTGSSEVVTEIGQVDIDSTSTDIYVKITSFSEVVATGLISGGIIFPTTGNSGPSQGTSSAPTGYTAITAQKIIMENTAGNVGIGTTSPSATLDVTSTAQNVLDLETTNSDGPLQAFINNGTVRGYIGNAEGAMGQGTANFAIRAQGELVIGTNGNNERMRITSGGNVGIGNGNTNPQSLLHVQATNNSAGDLYTQVGVGNCPGISIGNIGTSDNNNAALYFRNDGGERASVGARFLSHSNEKTELRFSTTNGSGATRERVKITGDGVIVATSTVSGSSAVNHFEISKTFSATGNAVTKHEINLINEIGATTAGNLHYQVSVGGYGSGGSNGVNATYSVAGYSGHSWSATNHGSMGAGTIQNGYKSSNSTSYDAKGLSYHPCINMGSYIQNGEVYAYSPGGQRYGFTISNNSSTAIAICITVRGWYR